MKGKLIKTDKGYILEGDNLPNPRRLSIKNCESIVNGYDLNELVKSKYPNAYNEDYEYFSEAEMLRDEYKSRGFYEGAKAIIEILGDNKFSEEDVLKIVTHVLNELVLVDGFDKKYLFPESIYQETTTKCKSLQQTEWEVFYNFEEKDSEGCLILKRL